MYIHRHSLTEWNRKQSMKQQQRRWRVSGSATVLALPPSADSGANSWLDSGSHRASVALAAAETSSPTAAGCQSAPQGSVGSSRHTAAGRVHSRCCCPAEGLCSWSSSWCRTWTDEATSCGPPTPPAGSLWWVCRRCRGTTVSVSPWPGGTACKRWQCYTTMEGNWTNCK